MIRSLLDKFLLSMIVIGSMMPLSCAAVNGKPDHPAIITQFHDSSLPQVGVCLWECQGNVTTEYPYIVDLAERAVTAQKIHQAVTAPPFMWAMHDAKETSRREEAYKRIVDRFRNEQAFANRNVDLESALKWMERSKGWGESPARFVVANPDGTRAVFAPGWNQPILLIDIATLKTRRLADNAGEPAPVAWSQDSRYVAYAPIGGKTLCLYDTQREVVASVKTGVASRFEAISWSPDGRLIAALGWQRRRMDINPLALLAAFAGHPMFRNDAVLSMYHVNGDEYFSVVLRRGIPEWGSPRVSIEWK